VKLRYLLDTDSVSDLIVRPQGPVAGQIGGVGERSVCTSIVVAAELRFGAAKRASVRLTRRVEAVLSAIRVLPFEEPADRHYAELREHLERIGTPIGPNDLLISAHALCLGLTVVTGNVREFARVPGLAVENWLA
jgi:tRNA(fMet)-specific endonuclease VapC